MSMGSTPASTSSSRLSTSRHHSHSVSLGAANSSHRITRRKSINAGAAHSAAAVAAALQEEVPGVSKRRSFNLKTTGSNRGFEPIKHEGSTSDQYPFIEGYRRGKNTIEYEDFAVADEFLSPEHAGSGFEKKARRASEGSHLTKSEGKRSGVELRCEKCGKEYKHSSCLTKHLSVIFRLYCLLAASSSPSITFLLFPPSILYHSMNPSVLIDLTIDYD